MQSADLLKIVIIGDAGVGKTSLLKRYVNAEFGTDYRPTIGADFCKKVVMVNDHPMTLEIWDTAGQERYRALNAAFYRGADCCVLVYDYNNRSTFESLDTRLDDFLKHANCNSQFVLLANKFDLENRQVSTKEALEWCMSKNNMSFFEISAKDGTNVEKVFLHMAENHVQQDIETLDEDLVVITETPKTRRFNCCY